MIKKCIAAVCVFLLLFPVFALGEQSDGQPVTYSEQEIDLDLLGLSGTMVYAQVCNILYYDSPSYLGKVIRISGWYAVFEDPAAGIVYFACIVPDAAACCAQGIEFVWAGEHLYPDDYPAPGTGVTVTGRLESYMEGEYEYLHLVDAQVVWEAEEPSGAL